MNLPRYPKYKPSGVDWLGEVPEHWELSRVGYVANKVGSGKTPRGGADNYRDEGVMLIRSQNVYDDGLRLDDVVFVDDEVDEDMAGTRVAAGDVLLNITGASIGRCALVPSPFVPANVNQHVCIVRPQRTKIRQAFLQNLLVSTLVKSQVLALENGSSREGLNFQQVRALSITLPPLPEQRAIADFLDRETGRIDALVGKKRELIARLKEKRAALITRAVTRGLDPAAKLKDSGVTWLGMVPEGWVVRRFSHVARIEEGQVDPEVEPYADMYLIAPNHVESGTGVLLCKETAAEQAAESGKYRCRAGDVVYSKIRPALAKVAMAEEDCLCSADMYPIRGVLGVENKYLYWSLLSRWFVEWSTLESARVAMPKINRETLSGCKLPLPPLAEQRAIADHLDRETGKLDRLTASIEAAIERLQEYRAALITAAVTGKIDVRGKSVQEPSVSPVSIM